MVKAARNPLPVRDNVINPEIQISAVVFAVLVPVTLFEGAPVVGGSSAKTFVITALGLKLGSFVRMLPGIALWVVDRKAACQAAERKSPFRKLSGGRLSTDVPPVCNRKPS